MTSTNINQLIRQIKMPELFAAGSVFYLALILFALLLLMLWTCLPFAVFGVKPILRDIVHELRIQNELLRTQLKGDAAVWDEAHKGDKQ